MVLERRECYVIASKDRIDINNTSAVKTTFYHLNIMDTIRRHLGIEHDVDVQLKANFDDDIRSIIVTMTYGNTVSPIAISHEGEIQFNNCMIINSDLTGPIFYRYGLGTFKPNLSDEVSIILSQFA